MKPRVNISLIAIIYSVLTIAGFTYTLSVEAGDPESDLVVSFRGEDGGLVVGNVKNTSANSYSCVRLKFYLLEGNRKSEYVSTDVRNIQPRSVVPYKVKLPRPAGFGHESTGICGAESPIETDVSTEPKTPEIISFRASPVSVEAGKEVALFWEVKDAKTVRIYEGNNELEGRIELPDGAFGWPLKMPGAFSVMLPKTTTYRLVAESSQGRSIVKTLTIGVRGTQLQGTYTIQQKSNRRYLDAHEGSHDNSVVTRNSQNNTTQAWVLTPLGNNVYTIQQKSNRRYLDAHEGSHDNSVITRNRQDNTTQAWILTPLGNNVYTIQQKSNRRYLDAHEGSHDNSVITRNKQDNTTQEWIINQI